VTKASSAVHGALPQRQEKGRVVLTLPALGYGGVIRLE
jgi:hypothetical protein